MIEMEIQIRPSSIPLVLNNDNPLKDHILQNFVLLNPKRIVKRTERGWPGHFICSYECVFHRNTLLECGDIRIIVSTIGNKYCYTHDENGYLKRTPDTVGYGRYYETLVFHAELNGMYWEINVEYPIYDCPLKWVIEHNELSADKEADEMHEAIVDWFTKKLELGETFERTEDD